MRYALMLSALLALGTAAGCVGQESPTPTALPVQPTRQATVTAQATPMRTAITAPTATKNATGVPGSPTSARTATPAATATMQPSIKLEFGTYSVYPTGLAGAYYVVGEIFNKSAVPIAQVDIEITMVDDKGAVLAKSGPNTTSFHITPANTKCPYRVEIHNSPSSWNGLKFSVRADPASDMLVRQVHLDLGLSGVALRPPKPNFGYGLTGKTINPTQVTAQSVSVRASAYDAAGKVIDSAVAFPSPTTLAPKEEATFDMDFRNLKDKAPASWSIFVQGLVVKTP